MSNRLCISFSSVRYKSSWKVGRYSKLYYKDWSWQKRWSLRRYMTMPLRNSCRMNLQDLKVRVTSIFRTHVYSDKRFCLLLFYKISMSCINNFLQSFRLLFIQYVIYRFNSATMTWLQGHVWWDRLNSIYAIWFWYYLQDVSKLSSVLSIFYD